MKDLTVRKYINGQLLVDSREVAEMIDKEHAHLMRDIRGYLEIINPNPNLDSAYFFIDSTYLDKQNQERPCYLLTKQGCEMVANKMTGEKGILFTAKYVQAFNQMEQAQKPKCIEDLIIMQAQQLKDMRLLAETATNKAIEAEAKAVEKARGASYKGCYRTKS